MTKVQWSATAQSGYRWGMDGDDILQRLYSLLPELEAEGNFLLARSTREVIAIVENGRGTDCPQRRVGKTVQQGA